MRTAFLILSLLFTSVLLADDLNLGQIKIPAVTSTLKTSEKMITKIESPIVTDSLGRVAKGVHNVFVTVFPTASYPLIIQGVEIKPGETKTISVNLSNTGNRLSIPVYPAVGAVSGSADYRVTISDIRVEVCPETFTEAKTDCYRILLREPTLGCEMGYDPLNPLTCSKTYQHEKKLQCEDGYSEVDGICSKVHNAQRITQCETGYSVNGDNCEKFEYSKIEPCNSDETFDGVSCIKVSLEPADEDGVCPDGTTPNRVNASFCDKKIITTPNLLCSGTAVTSTESCNDVGGRQACLSYSVDYGACLKRTNFVGEKVCPPGFADTASGGCELIETYTLETYCEAGYTLTSTSMCSKVELIPGSPYCELGYTRSGWGCTKITTESATPNCASGYNWNGSQCQKDSQAGATRKCISGYYWNGSQCQYDETKAATGNCSSGSWNGSNCESKLTRGYVSWSCPASHPKTSTLYAETCFYEYPPSDEADGCPAGYDYKWNRCVQYGSTIYNCDSGYSWNGSQCTRTVYSSPTSYSCQSGWTLWGSTCYYTAYQSPYYTCPSGWTLNGTNCYITYKIAPESYSCKPSFVLSQTTCTLTETATAKAACPSDYEVVDDRECTRTLTQSAIPNCPTGYTEVEGACELSITMPANPKCDLGFTFDGATSQCRQELRVPKLL